MATDAIYIDARYMPEIKKGFVIKDTKIDLYRVQSRRAKTFIGFSSAVVHTKNPIRQSDIY